MTSPYTEVQLNRGTCIDGLRKCNAVILKVQDVGLRDVDLLSDCCQIIGVAGKDER